MSNTKHTAAQTQINFRSTISSTAQTKSETVDWGTQFTATTEIEALRIAYAFRNAPHGVQVRFADHRDIYLITVFNELATTIGIDRS